MISAVIFDMDGLMFDTERMWETFWAPELVARGLPVPPTLAQESCGTTNEYLIQILKKYFGQSFDAVEFLNAYHKRANEAFFAAPVPKKEGLDELVAYFKAQGIPLAIGSSSDGKLVRNNLSQNKMLDDFSVLMTGDLIKNSKPAPDLFLAAAEQLGVSPSECLVLEDSHNGVRAGAAGGFITVMVPDLAPANDEMRGLYTAEYPSLSAVKAALEAGELGTLNGKKG